MLFPWKRLVLLYSRAYRHRLIALQTDIEFMAGKVSFTRHTNKSMAFQNALHRVTNGRVAIIETTILEINSASVVFRAVGKLSWHMAVR